MLDFTHVTQRVLIDPAFKGVTAGDSDFAAHARRKRLGDRGASGRVTITSEKVEGLTPSEKAIGKTPGTTTRLTCSRSIDAQASE